MTEQHFTIVLKGKGGLTEEAVERLYGCCDDVSAGSCDGVGHLHFDRTAASLNEAIASALKDVRSCGLDVERIEIEPNDIHASSHASA